MDSSIYGQSKTSFNTNTERSDDEAFGSLRSAERELTGKASSSEAWSELSDVLVTELKIAAARTTVSSVPAFLSEHLRRRLFKKDRKTMNDETKAEGGSAKPVTIIDAKHCPDCGGSSWWYPEGPEKGVTRCVHEKLNIQPKINT